MLAAVAAAVAVAVVLVSIGGSTVRARSPFHRTFTAVGAAPKARAKHVLPSGTGTLIGEVLVPTKLRAAPRGRVLASIGTRTQFGSPNVVAVVKVSSGWLGVLSESAGNGRLGWIPESAVLLGRDSWSVRVSLSARTLTVLEAGRVRGRYTVGIGAAASPTPIGRFAVTDRLVTNDPEGSYGCCILALTAVAPHAIPGWVGGDRVAIHATPDTETIGEPDSHGCMHLTQAEAHWLIYHVPEGTPVRISS